MSVTSPALVIDHDVDAPPAVAWDALVDQELVSGWLGEARIAAVEGGEYRLRWVGSVGAPGIDARVVAIDPPLSLTLSTDRSFDLSFRLTERAGGLRGTWTALTLTVTPHAAAVALPEAHEWRAALAQLDELLRGHPVDWGAVRRPAAAGDPREGSARDGSA